MAAQDNTNEVTNSTETGETRKEQECEAWSASQREAKELNAEGPARYEYYVTKERYLKHLTEIIVSGIDSMGETIEIQDRMMAELAKQKNGLEFNIFAARVELANLRKQLKGRRLRHKKLFRRNKYIQSLLIEEKALVAELAELKKKNTRKYESMVTSQRF